MDDRTALITLACTTEPGSSRVASLVAEYGPSGALDRLADELRAEPAAPGRLRADQIPAMLERMEQISARVVVRGELEFPSQLLDLAEPPLALWIRGPADLRTSALRSVSVVGARACTAYGERATGELANGLAAAGWTIVSGGAFGIDAAGHRAALAVGGLTVAVLACGIDVAYPRAHDGLLCRIGDCGVLVSELPPGSAPLKHRFLARNRLIAGLSRGTLVVEAARRSGAIATANRALELGREVMAVPGPITSMASAGTNRLLHEQSARAVSSPAEVIEILTSGWRVTPDDAWAEPSAGLGQARLDLSGFDGVGPGGVGPGGDGPVGRESPESEGAPTQTRPAPADRPADADVAVLEALPTRGGMDVGELSTRTGQSPATCLAQLGVLELQGRVRRTERGWRRIA